MIYYGSRFYRGSPWVATEFVLPESIPIKHSGTPRGLQGGGEKHNSITTKISLVLSLYAMVALPPSLTPRNQYFVLHLYNLVISRMLYKWTYIVCDLLRFSLYICPSSKLWVSAVLLFFLLSSNSMGVHCLFINLL